MSRQHLSNLLLAWFFANLFQTLQPIYAGHQYPGRAKSALQSVMALKRFL
jgi:hypothetical protein